MTDLAQTYFRQGRAFLRAGDTSRAVELLERARVIARDDISAMRDVLSELAVAYAQDGQPDRAARCREQMDFLPAAAPTAGQGVASPAAPTSDTPYPLYQPRQSWRKNGLFWAAALIVFLSVDVALFLYFRNRSSAGQSRATDASSSLTTPVTAVPAPASSTSPTSAAAVPGFTTSSTKPASNDQDLQSLVNQNVGLVVVSGRYEGTVNRQHAELEIPLGTASCFAVTRDGVLLTNKHVTAMLKSSEIPSSLEKAQLPTMTLRKTEVLVCFGPEASNQFRAKVVFESPTFDLAALKIDRAFAQPLTFADHPPRLDDESRVVGFPGNVQEALNEEYMTKDRIKEAVRRLSSGQTASVLNEFFSPESFKPTLTRGIISTAERNMQGVAYTQTDARIAHGNSGGPIFNDQRKVMAIATSEIGGDGGSWNFGLLIDQLRDELAPYLRESAGGH